MQLVGKIYHQRYIKMLIVNTLEKTLLLRESAVQKGAAEEG